MTKIILHADDFGLCNPVNKGIIKTLPDPITAASIMAPCESFEEAVSIYHAHNKRFDIGLHLTLTTGGVTAKYPPVNTDCPSLINADNVLWSSVEELTRHAKPHDVKKELNAQFVKTMEAGIDITHLDAHMFVGSIPMVAETMMKAAWDWRIPLVLKSPDNKQLNSQLARAGFPSFDTVTATKSAEQLKQHLASLHGGLHYVILHPAIFDYQLVQKLPKTWERRIDDYRLCTDGSLKSWISQYKLQAVGMREFRENLRNKHIWI